MSRVGGDERAGIAWSVMEPFSARLQNQGVLASESVGQTCDFETFVATGFTCGDTRTVLANGGTRVSRVEP